MKNPRLTLRALGFRIAVAAGLSLAATACQGGGGGESPDAAGPEAPGDARVVQPETGSIDARDPRPEAGSVDLGAPEPRDAAGTDRAQDGPGDMRLADAAADAGPVAYTIQRRWGRDWILYVEKGTHLVYLEAEDIARVPPTGGTLPDGITFLREEGLGNPWVFFREKRSGRWFQGDFRQTAVDFAGTEDRGACLPCHGQVHDTAMTDTIFTINLLRRFLATGAVNVLTCNPSTNAPCPPQVYR